MSKEKIKLLFDARNCIDFYVNSTTKSGIFYFTCNLLYELTKYEDLEIYLFSNYVQAYSCKNFIKKNKQFKNLKTVPQTPFISYIQFWCDYLKEKYKKRPKNDNILKKSVRFFCTKIIEKIRIAGIAEKKYLKNIDSYDVILSSFNQPQKVILKELGSIKKIICIHDLIPYVMGDKIKCMELKYFDPIIEYAKTADICIAISNNTKNDLIKYAPQISPDKVKIAYLGASNTFYRRDTKEIQKVKKKYNIPPNKRIVFSIGNIEERKNLIFAIENFINFVHKNKVNNLIMVISGGTFNIDVQNKIKLLIKENPDLIYLTDYVDDEDVAALYSMSDIFVYVSLYEGFGLPVLEAMSCGCPTITSNRSSLPEVVGDAGIMIDPKNNEQMQEALSKMYFDENLRKEYIKKGYKRAKMFSWEKCAKIVYENMKK